MFRWCRSRTVARLSPIKADVANAHVSPLGNESFASMDPGGRDTFVWMQNGEPAGLWCADESDGEALRVCEQVTEGVAVVRNLVVRTSSLVSPHACDANDDLTEWTCTAARRRQVPRRLGLRRERRCHVLVRPVGCGKPAPRWT